MKMRRIVNSELSLVAYDITDDRRRRRVAEICSGFAPPPPAVVRV
jgi:hypothetical protein